MCNANTFGRTLTNCTFLFIHQRSKVIPVYLLARRRRKEQYDDWFLKGDFLSEIKVVSGKKEESPSNEKNVLVADVPGRHGGDEGGVGRRGAGRGGGEGEGGEEGWGRTGGEK